MNGGEGVTVDVILPMEKAGDDRARRAAGAEDQAVALAQIQTVALGDVAHQSRAIGVVAAPVLVEAARERVHRADAAREIRNFRAQRQHGLLVRQGDVRAAPVECP